MRAFDMITDERLREILAGTESVTPGPWFYRPTPHDDWGWVRTSPPGDGGPGWLVATAKRGRAEQPGEDAIHRETKTDPYGANAAHIARLDPQTITSIVTELLSRREAEEAEVPCPRARRAASKDAEPVRNAALEEAAAIHDAEFALVEQLLRSQEVEPGDATYAALVQIGGVHKICAHRIRELKRHPSTGGDGGVRVKVEADERDTDTLTKASDFLHVAAHKARGDGAHESASRLEALSEALLKMASAAIEPVAASPGVPERENDDWPLLVDGDKSWRVPPGKLSTLMGHGLLGKRADGTYRLCDSEEMERDPGSAGVNNPRALAVLAVVRAALAAAPTSPEPSPASEDVLAEGIDQLLAELKRWDRFVFGDTVQVRGGVDMMKQAMIERLTALRALSSKQRSEKE
jgi:hypothetical protein